MLFGFHWGEILSLLSVVCGGSIAGAGLNTQQGRWTKHPQAADDIGKFSPYSNLTGLVRLVRPLFGGMGREPSGLTANPPLRLLCRRCFAAARSTLSLSDIGKLSMIYSFLIAPQSLPVAELNRIRIVSCYARNLKQARASFAGLSIALLSRKPAGGQANA